jgi:ADP-heptose:LPS heptosyltransferase
LTHWVKEIEPEQLIRHEVRRQLDLVAAVGCRSDDERIVARVPDGAPERVSALLRGIGVRQELPWLVVHPGATAASRRYPPEGFAAVARRLTEEGWQVVFTGTEPECELVEQIQAGMGVRSYSLVGELELGELAALLKAAPLLLSNNTGTVHVAAGVGTPVVDLYALTHPQHTPWGVPSRVLSHDVPCKYCYKSVCPEGHHHCLRLVTPDQVVQAVQELAAVTGRSQGGPFWEAQESLLIS